MSYSAAGHVLGDPALTSELHSLGGLLSRGRDAIFARDFVELRTTSYRLMASAQLGMMLTDRSRPALALHVSEEDRARRDAALLELQSWDSEKQTDALEQLLAASRQVAPDAEAMIQALWAKAVSDPVKAPRQEVGEGETTATGYFLAGLARGLLGIAHSAFNDGYRVGAQKDDPHELSKDLERRYDSALRRLYGAFLTKEATAVRDAASGILVAFQRTLEDDCATIGVHSRGLYGGTGPSSLAWRTALRRASHLIRRHATLAVACGRLTGGESPFELLPDASTVALYTPIPNGTDTRLGELAERSPGDFVEVEGIVAKIEATRSRDAKLISVLTLENASQTAKTHALMTFVHARHIGISEGGSVRLSGTLDTQSGFVEAGETAIQVDRLALRDLARDAFEPSVITWAEPWLALYPNGVNASWTLAPHSDAHGGANELIFSRLRAS